ncbi:Pycsar system effector family protein [Kribbella lupini]|uniref:Pycsar effector protein domain-containing protein n=1 Tax=Kribbella lupini TaxID=291602 RepID=A0ABN2B0D3_9ACTN
MSTHLDLAKWMHDSAAGAIERADNKAGFAVPVETALTAVVLALVSQSGGSPIGARVLLGLSLIALAVAIAAAMLVVVPRLHTPGEQLVPGEFLYFGAVRLRSMEQLRRHLNPNPHAYPSEEVAGPCEAVSHQAKVLSEIAWSKHRLVRVSFLAVSVGGFLAAAGWLLGGGR